MPSTPSREPESAVEALRDQPEDGRQVEGPDLGRRPVHRTEGAEVDGPIDRGRGDRGCLSAAHAVAARRLPLRTAGNDPASDALVFASLSAAPRHLAVARRRWRQADQTQVQGLCDRLLHIDIAEVRTAEGQLHLFVAIDRTSKYAFVQLAKTANTVVACGFLEALVAAVPYKVHTVLTDNGIQFADLPKNRLGPTARFRGHPFDRSCQKFGVEHRLTKPKHPWTNGQVERMNRTIKEATVKRFHYDSHDQLTSHLADFIAAYNFGRRLKTLKGLTPYEAICKTWTKEPERFTLDPIHQMPGLNT